MLKRTKNEIYVDKNGKKHLAPSDLGGCLRAVQLRYQNAQEDRINYYMMKGGLAHDVVEELLKSTNPATTRAWSKVWKRQRYIPWEWRSPLWRVMPKIEDSFKNFLLSTPFGKSLMKASPVWIEEKIEVPLQDLRLRLPFPKKVLQSYVVVGQPDCYFSNLVLEFKTGVIQKRHFLQGLLYEKIAQLHYKNPRIRNRLVKIKPRTVETRMASKFWTKNGKYRKMKEQELVNELTRMITHLESWAKNPSYLMPKTVSASCYSCVYYSRCFNPVERKLKALLYKIGRNVRRVKKNLSMIVKSSNKKRGNRDRSIKSPTLNIPKKI